MANLYLFGFFRNPGCIDFINITFDEEIEQYLILQLAFLIRKLVDDVISDSFDWWNLFDPIRSIAGDVIKV
jgi:hypothetical protein